MDTLHVPFEVLHEAVDDDRRWGDGGDTAGSASLLRIAAVWVGASRDGTVPGRKILVVGVKVVTQLMEVSICTGERRARRHLVAINAFEGLHSSEGDRPWIEIVQVDRGAR